MRKSVTMALAAAGLLALAAPSVLAADRVVLKVEIPFNFVVADQQLPAGSYRIVEAQDPGAVRIYSNGQKHLLTTFCLQASPDLAQRRTLVFHRHDGRYFLKTIRGADGFGAYLPETRSEKQAQASARSATAVAMR